MKKIIYRSLFVLLLFFGLILRIYNLTNIPAGFFCDEASIGYNAYTILKDGTDEYGNSYPLFFQSFGEFKSPIQIYSTVPLVSIFGLSEFSTRLTSSIYGFLSLLAIYFLTKELFKENKRKTEIALLALLFLTISPWHIHFSRIAFELMPFVFFTTFGMYLFLKAQNTPLLLLLSVSSFTLALYSYFPARIFIPLFGIGLFILYFKFFLKNKKISFLTLCILIVFLIPFFQNMLSPVILGRWEQVNVFSKPLKDQNVITHIASNYFRHFSADFLFLKGDVGMPGQFITRHSVRDLGELYLFQLPLILLALIYLIRKPNKVFFVLLLWLALFPTGSMFTVDDSPQATRSIIGVIPLQILSAFGLYLFFQKIYKFKYFFLAFVFFASVIIFNSINNYLNLYYNYYPSYSSDYWGWQYGAKDIIKYYTEQNDNYDDLVMATNFNAPDIFFKFYSPNGCINCKLGFPNDTYIPHHKQIFAVPPSYMKENPNWTYNIKKYIYYPDNTIAFTIAEVRPRK